MPEHLSGEEVREHPDPPILCPALSVKVLKTPTTPMIILELEVGEQQDWNERQAPVKTDWPQQSWSNGEPQVEIAGVRGGCPGTAGEP